MSYGQPCSSKTGGPPAGPVSTYPTSSTPALICLRFACTTSPFLSWSELTARACSSALGLVGLGGSEELSEQFGDAVWLVVMDPMRRVRQAHHSVEVGNIGAVGFGQVAAQVAVALPP